MSINLNTGQYDGGHLVFPEYNGYRYKPGLGAALVFSATLLHEGTPVLKGARYVLLTFVHNAEAEWRRRAAAEIASAWTKAWRIRAGATRVVGPPAQVGTMEPRTSQGAP